MRDPDDFSLRGSNIVFKPDGDRPRTTDQPFLLRFLAHVFSFIFHPLFIPCYIAFFLIYIHPYAFAGFGEKGKLFKWIQVFISTCFFPAFSVFLLARLGFAQSIQLKNQKERIIPYTLSMIFFFWAFYVSKNQPDNPPLLIILLLGLFITCIAGMLANIYFKVSMHGMAMGGLVMFFIVL